MNEFYLSSWLSGRVLEVERLAAESEPLAVAYAAGRLDERTAHIQGRNLLARGVCYRLDRKPPDDDFIDLVDATRIGDWFPIDGETGPRPVWVPHRTEKCPTSPAVEDIASVGHVD